MPLDPAYYDWTQNFGGEFVTLDDLKAEGVEYVLLSDLFYHDIERSAEIAAPAYLDQIETYLAPFKALPEVAHIDRAVLLGDDWMMYTVTPWHNPGITVYCVTAASCAAVR